MSRFPRDPGLRVHHDVRNEKYLLEHALNAAAPRARAVAGVTEPFKPKTVHHQQYRRYDQGQTPGCTGFSCVTLCAAAHPFQAPPVDGAEWYAKNQAFDRAHGRFYEEGATTIASLEVGRQLGLWPAYRWAYTIETMQRAILNGPLVAGTYWYDSMFERDREGIVHVPRASDYTEAGHQYILGAYDAKRDLWDVEQTWEPTPAEVATMPYHGWVWRIPGDLMFRLLREEGEVAQVDEVKLPKQKAA